MFFTTSSTCWTIHNNDGASRLMRHTENDGLFLVIQLDTNFDISEQVSVHYLSWSSAVQRQTTWNLNQPNTALSELKGSP